MTDAQLPVPGTWRTEPLAWHTDLDHGGRWWSLTTAQREWLWTNPDAATAAARLGVRPGDAFVDAGGAEECFPNIRGVPDHGDAWSRIWSGARLGSRAETAYGRVDRLVTEDHGLVHVDYRIEPSDEALRREAGPTGPITHAIHLLLDVSPAATITVPGAGTMSVLDRPEVGEETGATWPVIDGEDLSRLGPDDQTATCAVLRGLAGRDGVAEAYVVDGDAALGLRWASEDANAGMMLWRNLRGWPDDKPYRSIGVEPLVEFGGATTWWLEVTAYERA